MSWLWNAVGAKLNVRKSSRKNAPVMTRQTSLRIQQFEKGERKTGSLVLTKDDIKAMNIQGKIENTRRNIDHQRGYHQDELEALRNLKANLMLQLNQKLNQQNELSVYQEVVQNAFLQEGITMADPGDGIKEAEILKQIHKSESMDKSRVRFQQQASDELMEVYKTAPKFKERMGEREAKLLSLIFQQDSLMAKRKELNENILRIQQQMIVLLEKAAQEQFQKRYEAIRDGNDAEDGDLVSRNDKRSAGETRISYSARVTGSSPKDIERKHPVEGLRDVILEEDHSDEAHIGEVKTRETAGISLSYARSAGRSPVTSTAARRGELSNRGTASTTTRVRARPVPPSRAGADRSPTRQTSDVTTTRETRTPATRPNISAASGARRPVTGGMTAGRPTRSLIRTTQKEDAGPEE